MRGVFHLAVSSRSLCPLVMFEVRVALAQVKVVVFEQSPSRHLIRCRERLNYILVLNLPLFSSVGSGPTAAEMLFGRATLFTLRSFR